jgi:hypothetical protein
VLGGGLHTGPVIAEIVHGGAVDERAGAFALGDRPQPVEQFVLAEEAAVGAVACVLRVRQLLGAHDLVAQAHQSCELPRLFQLARGIGLGIRGHEHRAIAERVLGRAGQQCGIHAARERDDDAVEPAQHVNESIVFRLCCRAHARSRRMRSSNSA